EPAQAKESAPADAAPPPAAEPAAPAPAVPVPVGTILGHVFRPDGSPAKGAQVRLKGQLRGADGLIPGGGEVSRTTEVDDEGFYRFEGLAPGCYDLRAECGGYAPLNSGHGYIINEKGGARWFARLRPGGTLVVVLRDLAGAPLAGVEVETASGATAPTDATGQAVFAHLAAGAYPVIVRGGHDETRMAKVEDGVTTTVTVVLGAVLRGTVTLEDGTPVPNAPMQASLELTGGAGCFAEGGTDPSGRYEFRGLGPGAWEIRMGYVGVWSAPRPARIGDDPVTSLDLRLKRPSIAGRLVRSGKGFSPGMVRLFREPEGTVGSIAVTEEGAFTFYDLAPGGYVISVQPHRSGYARCEVPVKVEAGQRLDGVEIPVEEIRYGEVELEILDGNGAPAESVQVFVGDREGKLRRSTSMGGPVSPGRFRATVECGKREITVQDSGREVRVDVEVEEGKTIYRTVRLPK
ncbi:MAG: carboxypeptidase-like regulatory domain-containing protein, partial [Planctomycetes bacterium]|nr:carboxypeptidase-like regulatory domain-containing protein [Planctomycetota bacterium]